MKNKLRWLNCRALAVATAAAYLLSLATSPVGAQPLTLNGDGPENIFENEGVLNYSPAPVYIGLGGGEDAENTVVEQTNTRLVFGGPSRVADSDGTGQHNTVVWNLDGDSFVQVGADFNGLANVLAYDGSVTINIDGHSAPNGGVLDPEPLSGAWGNLRTERVTLAAREGSSATVNLTGPHANWYAWSRHIDIAPGGTGIVNVVEGAGLAEAQRIVVGGTRWSETSVDPLTGEPTFPEGSVNGEGFLTVDGEGSLVRFADNINAYLVIGRRTTGTMTVSNGAVVDAATNTIAAGLPVWVGSRPGGDGTLIIEKGGVLNTNGRLRINSNGSDSSYVRVDGFGSQLNVIGSGDTMSYIGDTGTNPGAKGVLDIVNGGSAVFRSDDVLRRLRIANQAESIGEVNVDGEGSILEVGDYLQIGYSGTGTLNLTGGGQLLVGDEGGGASSIGRASAGNGTFVVDGGGSRATFDNALWVAAGSNDFYDEGTGTGALEVTNGGVVEVGALLAVRGTDVIEVDDEIVAVNSNGSVFLDNGTIRMTGPDPVTVVGPQASLTGEGLIEGDLLVANDALVAGTGAGISVTGTVGGTGEVENLTVGAVRATTDMGSLTLNNVRFSEDAVVNVVISDLSDANGLLAYDSNTSLAGTHLDVSVLVFIEDPDWSAQILPAGVDHGFASVTVPEGWKYENGVLRVDGDTPPPPPPAFVSNFIHAGSNENWTLVDNWDTEEFPNSPNAVAQFGQAMGHDRVQILFSSSLLTTPGVLEVGSIRILPEFDPTEDIFYIRNYSAGTHGTLKLYGYPETIGDKEVNLLLGNFGWPSTVRMSPSNAGMVIELNGSGVFHNEGGLFRVSTEITEAPEGPPQSITKTGPGILRFDRRNSTHSSEHSTYSGGFTLEEGIVEWTNSGGSAASPFGIGPLTLKDGTLRSTTNSGRFVYTSMVLDGEITIGSLEEGFLGHIIVDSADGERLTTLASDSTINTLSYADWRQGTIGDFGLTKTGPDELIFTGAGGSVDHSGPTTVAEGMLRLNTSVNTSPITVQDGGSLGFGENTIVGRGAVFSDLTLEEGANMVFRLEGPDASDSVQTYGALNVNGSELVLELGYQPAINDTFTLIQHSGETPANGSFSSSGVPLTEGSRFTVASNGFSQRFAISYQDGGGMDVTITAVEDAVAGPYTDWADGYGLTGADAAPGANPTGDGFTNLEKFAFGLNPTVSAASLADVSRDGDLLVLRWNQRTEGGIAYVVETSATLASGSWTEVTGAEPTVMGNPDVVPPAGYERVEWTVDAGGEGDRSFYRASASVDGALLP